MEQSHNYSHNQNTRAGNAKYFNAAYISRLLEQRGISFASCVLNSVNTGYEVKGFDGIPMLGIYEAYDVPEGVGSLNAYTACVYGDSVQCEHLWNYLYTPRFSTIYQAIQWAALVLNKEIV